MNAKKDLEVDTAAQSLFEAVLVLINESDNKKAIVNKIKRYMANGDTTGLHGIFIRLSDSSNARKQYLLFFSQIDKADLKDILYRLEPVFQEYIRNHGL